MKGNGTRRIIAFALVIICALFIAHNYKLVSVAVLTEDGYAVDADLAGGLRSGKTDEVLLTPVQTGDEVWQRGSSYYIGEKQEKALTAYPMYLYGGTAVMTLSGNMLLYDEDFLTVSSIPGMYVSDGIAFLKDHSQTDEDAYIFMKLGNGLFINTKEMTVTGSTGETVVPLNSMLYLDEQEVRYYGYRSGSLGYQETAAAGATVQIGSVEMSYADLLQALGLGASASTSPKTDEEETEQEITSVSGISQEIGASSTGGANQDKSDTQKKEENGTKKDDSQSSGQSSASSESQAGNSAGASAADGSSGSSSGKDKGSSGKDKDAGNTGKDNASETPADNNGNNGTDNSTAGGEITGGDSNTAGNENPGESGSTGTDDNTGTPSDNTDIGEPSDSNANAGNQTPDSGNQNPEDPVTPEPVVPQPPEVVLSDMKTGVYTLTMNVDITDKYHILNKVLIEAYWDQNGDGKITDDEAGSRKSLKKSGEAVLSSIPPDTELLIVAKYYYYDDNTKKIAVFYDEFVTGSSGLKTKALDTLPPVYVDFQTDTEDSKYQENTISLYELKLDGSQELLNYVYRLKVTLTSETDASDTHSFYMNRSVLQKYITEPGTWTSDARSYMLKSNTRYRIKVEALDNFGNVLKTRQGTYDESLNHTLDQDYSDLESEPVTGESRTCRMKPQAEIEVTNLSLERQKVKIQITDPDDALMDGRRLDYYICKSGTDEKVPLFFESSTDQDLALTDENGNLFYQTVPFSCKDGEDRKGTWSFEWTLGENNLEVGEVYTLYVETSYSLDTSDRLDDTEEQIEGEIADGTFITTDIATLGKAAYTLKTISLNDISGEVSIGLARSKMDARLINHFLSSMEVTMSERAGAKEMVYDLTLERSVLGVENPLDQGLLALDSESGRYYLTEKAYELETGKRGLAEKLKIYLPGYDPDGGISIWSYLCTADDTRSPGTFVLELLDGSMTSYTSYQVTVSTQAETVSVGDKGTKSKFHNVDPSKADLKTLTFTTLRHLPEVAWEDVVLMGDKLYLYGLEFSDWDKAILSESVTLKIIYPAQNRAEVRTKTLPLKYEKTSSGKYRAYVDGTVTFEGLVENSNYELEIYADTLALSSAKRETNYLLGSAWPFTAGQGISGDLMMTDMSAASGGNGYDVKVRVQVDDKRNNLKNHPDFRFTLYESNSLSPDWTDKNSYREVTDTYVSADLLAQMTLGVSGGVTGTYDQTLILSLPADKSYRAELAATYKNSSTEEELMLDTMEFSTEQALNVISCEEDWLKLSKNTEARYGKYLVTNDLTFVYSPQPGEAGINTYHCTETFYGSIDFDGHSITVEYNSSNQNAATSKAMIEALGPDAVIENMVLNFVVDGTSKLSYERGGSFIYRNEGTLRNIVINNDYRTGRLGHYQIAPIINNVGTVENFSISYSATSTNYSAKQMAGLAVNNFGGTIRNGYVYSSRDRVIGSGVYTGSSGDRSYSSGMVGYNSNGGVIENCYGYMNIVTEKGSAENYTGILCGLNGATIRNCFTIGDRYRYEYLNGEQQASAIWNTYNPGIGSYTAAATSSNIRYFGNTEYGTDYTRETNYNLLSNAGWYASRLGGSDAWLVDSQISQGYMPKVNMPDCIVNKQYNVQIPSGSTVFRPSYLSSNVLREQYEENGTVLGQVQLVFTNRGRVDLKDIEIDGLTIVSYDGQGVDEESGNWVVNLTVSPQLYQSSYLLKSYNYEGAAAVTTCSEPVEISFRTGLSMENWMSTQIYDSGYYYLLEDIDFSQLPDGAVEKFRNEFSGTFDGDGHSLKNLTLAEAFFSSLKGADIENVRVEGLTFTGSEDKQGFIGTASGGTTLNYIFLRDVTMPEIRHYGGALAGYITNSTVTNCGAVKVKQTASAEGGSITQGGLIGEANATPVKNSFVRELDSTNRKSGTQRGIGGLVGYASGLPTITSCYAEGSIATSYVNAGGIAGCTEGIISGCRSAVDIVSSAGNLGGIAGLATSKDDDYNNQASAWYGTNIYNIMNNLATGELYSSTTEISDRLIGAISTTRPQKKNGTAYQGQRLNSTTSTKLLGADRLATADNMKSSSFLRVTAGLGNAYCYLSYSDSDTGYSGVAAGKLPILYATDGRTVLPWQGDTAYGAGDFAMKIESASGICDENGNYPELKVTVLCGAEGIRENYENIVLTEENNALTLELDYSQIEPNAGTITVQADGQTKELPAVRLTYKVTPNQYLDSYRLKAQLDGQKVTTRLAFTINGAAEEPLYRVIKNVNEWANVMGQYGKNQENFRIVGDINFQENASAAAAENLQLVVNRIVGTVTDGKVPVISHLTASGNRPALFASVVTEMKNLSFEDISLTNTSKDGGNYMGLILESTASIENVAFRKITINSGNYNYVGCIGSSNGPLKDIVAEDLTITATSGFYIAGVAGDQEQPVENLTVRGNTTTNPGTKDMTSSYTVTAGTSECVGGVFGYVATTLKDVNINGICVTGGTYTGGMSGMIQWKTNDSKYRTTITDSKIYSTQSNCGGISGRENNLSSEPGYFMVDHCYITARGYAAGILGHISQALTHWYMVVKNSTIETTVGERAAGICPYDVGFRYCVVDHCTITAATNHAGGLGNGTLRYITYNLVKDCEITAKGSYAGGIVSNFTYSGTTQMCYNTVVDTTVTATGNYAGGLLGNSYGHNVFNNTVKNVKVTANSYVGGIAGAVYGGIYQRNAVKATVTATNRIAGGAIGYGRGYCYVASETSDMALQMKNNYVVADVSADEQAAGFIGQFSLPDKTPTRADGTEVNENQNYYPYMNGSLFSNNLLAVKLTYRDKCAWYALNQNGTDIHSNNYGMNDVRPMNGLRIYAGSTMKKSGTASATTPAGVYGSWKASEGNLADVRTVTTADMMTSTLYTSGLAWPTGDGGYSVANVADGILPKLKWTNAITVENYWQTTKSYGDIVNLSGLDLSILIPDNGSTTSLSLTEEALTPDIHAGGVDILILEFPGLDGMLPAVVDAEPAAVQTVDSVNAVSVADLTETEDSANAVYVELLDKSGNSLLREALTEEVLTIPYDYSSTLTVRVSSGTTSVDCELIPTDYQRRVLVWEDDYYIARSSGLKNGEGEYLTASGWAESAEDALPVIHLADGQALTADGEIYDLANGTKVENSGIHLQALAGAQVAVQTADTADQTQAAVQTTGADDQTQADIESDLVLENKGIYSFEVDGSQVESYRNFTYITGADGSVTKQNAMMLFKKGSSIGIEPQVDMDPYGVVYDTYLDTTYLMTLQSGDLVIYPFGGTPVLPEGLKTSGIAQMTNTLHTDRPIVVLLYQNGSAVAFNYMTGELLESYEQETEDTGFISFLKGTIADWAKNLSEPIVITGPTGSTENLLTALQKNPYSEDDLVRIMGTGEENGTAEEYGGTGIPSGTDESSDKAGAAGPSDGNGTSEEDGGPGMPDKAAGAASEDGTYEGDGDTGKTIDSIRSDAAVNDGSQSSAADTEGTNTVSGQSVGDKNGAAAEQGIISQNSGSQGAVGQTGTAQGTISQNDGSQKSDVQSADAQNDAQGAGSQSAAQSTGSQNNAQSAGSRNIAGQDGATQDTASKSGSEQGLATDTAGMESTSDTAADAETASGTTAASGAYEPDGTAQGDNPGAGDLTGTGADASGTGEALTDGAAGATDARGIADGTAASGAAGSDDGTNGKRSNYTIMISDQTDEFQVYQTDTLMTQPASTAMSENEKTQYLAAAGLYELYNTEQKTLTSQSENGLRSFLAAVGGIGVLMGCLYLVRRKKNSGKG